MSATHGAWDAAVPNAVPAETLVYRGLSIQDDRDLFVIHAALLHTGKVLWFCGHTERMHYATVSYVFDPDNGSLTRVPFPSGMDLFCCHYVQMADGRLLTVGGSDPDFAAHSSRGAKNIVVFDPTPSPGNPAGRWIDTGKELVRGRWYPTAVLLGDGRVLVFSGRMEFGRNDAANAHIAPEVEVISPPDFTSRLVSGADLHLPLYPGLHLAPNGQIYYTHTNWGQQIPEPTTRSLEVTGPTSAKWNNHNIRPSRPRREEGMSVLLPPAQDGKILVVGGSLALDAAGTGILMPGGAGTNGMDRIFDVADAVSAQILDTRAAPPAWSDAPGNGRTAQPRINGHLVLLPDATVLVCGGHGHYKWKANPPTVPSLPAEIYTPGVGFRPAASTAHPRMYHSTALLLPDGRVVIAGGADANGVEPPQPGGYPTGWPADLNWTGYPLNRKEREIYRPPYFFTGPRPTITDVQRNGASVRQLPYGSTFVVTTPQGPDITAVALMRPGATTHHTDSEQRYVPLTFTHTGNDLTVTMLPQAQSATLPPGYYMLWIVDSTARPCERALFVHVPLLAPPAGGGGGGGGGCPCVILTATMVTGTMLTAPAAEVVTLRRIRGELATGTAAGARLVGAVNGAYGRVSPPLAAWLRRHERARVATRDVVVRPGTAAVRAAERATAAIGPVSARHTALIVLLLLIATGGLAALPLLAVAMAVHIAGGARGDRRTRRTRGGRDGR